MSRGLLDALGGEEEDEEAEKEDEDSDSYC